MLSDNENGWNGNVLGVIQEGQVVASFGEDFTSGTSHNATLSIKKGVEAKIVFIAFSIFLPNGSISIPFAPQSEFLYSIRYYMWSQGVPVFSKPYNSPYQGGYVFGSFCLGGCVVATTDSVFVTLTDSGADGWNGNSLRFSQGQTTEEFGLNFTSGATNGPLEFVVNVNANFSILPYTLGEYRNEVGFVVKDKYNNVIVQRLPGSSYTAADLLATHCLGCVNYLPVQIKRVQATSSQTEVAAT